MKNKKAIGFVVSLVLTLGVALPNTLAVCAESIDTSSACSVDSMQTTKQDCAAPSESTEYNQQSVLQEESVQLDAENSLASNEELPHSENAFVQENGSSEQENQLSQMDHAALQVDSESAVSSCVQNDIEAKEELCDKQSLFQKLMECKTLEEMYAVIDASPEQELLALTEEENAKIEAKVTALEPEPLPPVMLEDFVNETVISKIIYPAVTFNNVAPFGAPVKG